MFTTTTTDGVICVTCQCGQVHVMRELEPRGHQCALTGKFQAYWPPDFDMQAYTEARNPPPKEKPVDTSQPPNLARKALNFGRAAVKHVYHGMKTATDEQVQERFTICQGCELFEPKGEGMGVCKHPSCGCALKRVGVTGKNKLRWADSKCPIGKWNALPSTPEPTPL